MSFILLIAAALTLPGSIIEIEEDGKSSEIRKDIHKSVALESGGIYGFSYSAKSDAPAHCLAGTWFAALGRSEPGDGIWRKRQSIFAVPYRGKTFQTRFHFGQWRPNGKVEIKDVNIVQLEAEYLKKGMLELGGGERLDGNEYLYSFPFGYSGRSHSRPLLSFDCPFNGRLWWFNPGSRVTYKHSLEGRNFVRGEVFVGTSDWSDAKGSVLVEISSDEKSWHKVGNVVSRTSVDAELPKDIFPCKTVFVRLTGGTNGTIQIAHYNFKGTVDGNPIRMFGETRYVEKDSGNVFAEIGKSFYDDDNYGSLLVSDNSVDLWTAGSGRKVVSTRYAPKKKSHGLILRTAANEAESVQLVIRARTDISDVKVSLRDDLVCEKSGFCMPAACVNVKRVGYVDVRHPTDFEGLPISVPDKLLAIDLKPTTVKAGSNQPFWVTVRPPKGTNKGVYSGVMDVAVTHKGGKKYRYSVPVQVEVFGFDLPDTMTCQTAFGLTSSLIKKAHGLKDNSPEYRDVIESYLRAMSENHISPYFPAMLAHYKVKWEGDTPVFDFKDWERELKRVFSTYHFNTFMVWLPGLGECNMISRRDPEFMGMKPGNPRYEKRLGAYVAEIEKFLKRKGWLDKAYAYVYDEPRFCDYDLVKFGYGFLEKHAPGLRRMLPALAHHAFKELSGPVNLWCPQIQYLDSPELRNVREKGDKVWWYICNNPKAPYACDFIDHPAPELRIWLWQTWKKRVDGILIWDVFNWRGQTNHPDQNGEGRFLYPPEECANSKESVVADPIQSVRIVHLRDGLEDYEYFAILKRLSPDNPLLQVPDSVTASLTDFSRDLGELEKHRIRLAREIERLCGR